MKGRKIHTIQILNLKVGTLFTISMQLEWKIFQTTKDTNPREKIQSKFLATKIMQKEGVVEK